MLIGQREFLNDRNSSGLRRIFGAKKTANKLKIEIGLQELKISHLGKRKARNGADMMVVKLWKAPVEFDQLRTKKSYASIDCYHMLRSECSGNFEEMWYKPFTSCLDESSFTAIKKGDTFLFLIQHVERLFEKDGVVMTYEKGERFGNDIILVQPEIVSMYPLGTEVDVNYFNLYKPLRTKFIKNGTK